ncbi:Snf7 family protein [Hyperthermus butylicus]|uniref:Conserved crenarchaeal protein n=1 Tax=Hyperthermus butylicus (strain DSM 5456 / JCM 9403 / PLM1-5) TaxID=415426 RepID=A2BMT1_HYPBU|nr:Snf7 family protein [Hyperthermus butylicus]ABM81292.1 conserved crenarchaeal protein [Hyperthermus butylicus DSM 5456]
MARVEDFAKVWSPQPKEPGIIEKIKNTINPPPPLRHKLAIALYKLRVQNNKLEYIIAKMKERDQALFEKVVQAQIEKDQTRAAMYAAEVAELRKMIKSLLTAKYAIERVTLRLETVMTMGDVLVGLAPVVGVIKDLRRYLTSLVPEIGIEMAEIGELLESVVTEAGEFTSFMSMPSYYSEEAKKIMEEAAAVAEQRMKAEFPELPTAFPTPSGQQDQK